MFGELKNLNSLLHQQVSASASFNSLLGVESSFGPLGMARALTCTDGDVAICSCGLTTIMMMLHSPLDVPLEAAAFARIFNSAAKVISKEKLLVSAYKQKLT